MLAEEWRSYQEQVIPPAAPSVQITESRRAFYAGARSILSILLERLSPGTEPTQEDLAWMDKIEAELDQFQRDVQAGQA